MPSCRLLTRARARWSSSGVRRCVTGRRRCVGLVIDESERRLLRMFLSRLIALMQLLFSTLSISPVTDWTQASASNVLLPPALIERLASVRPPKHVVHTRTEEQLCSRFCFCFALRSCRPEVNDDVNLETWLLPTQE